MPGVASVRAGALPRRGPGGKRAMQRRGALRNAPHAAELQMVHDPLRDGLESVVVAGPAPLRPQVLRLEQRHLDGEEEVFAGNRVVVVGVGHGGRVAWEHMTIIKALSREMTVPRRALGFTVRAPAAFRPPGGAHEPRRGRPRRRETCSRRVRATAPRGEICRERSRGVPVQDAVNLVLPCVGPSDLHIVDALPLALRPFVGNRALYRVRQWFVAAIGLDQLLSLLVGDFRAPIPSSTSG